MLGVLCLSVAIQRVRLDERDSDFFCNHLDPAGGQRFIRPEALDHYHVFVAAQPGNCVLRPHAGNDTLRDLNQQPIADIVSHGVVDGLEVVEIENHQRAKFCGAIAGSQCLVQAIKHQPPVGEVCQ